MLNGTKQLKKIRRQDEMPKRRIPWKWRLRHFPHDIDGYFYDSFSYDTTDVLSWLTHLILVQWLNSFITLFPHISYHSHDESNVLPYCHLFLLSWLLFLCHIIIFPMAALVCLLRLHVTTHFWLIVLTHFILHASRIFQQWCHNHIVCLVVETALHVYKGQFSPWLGQFITGIRHQYSSDSIFASVKVQSRHSTSRLCLFWSVKTLQYLLTILHHNCLHHQVSGPFVTWEKIYQILPSYTWNMSKCVFGFGI